MKTDNRPTTAGTQPTLPGGATIGGERPATDERLASIVELHWDWVRALAQRRLRDAALAEDAAQAVFILAWKRLSSRRLSDAALRCWLGRSTKYVCKNLLRSEQRRAARLGDFAAQFGQLRGRGGGGGHHAFAEIESALSSLAPADREIVVSRFVEGESLRAVAGRLGISLRTAQLRARRAISKMRRELSEGGVIAPLWLLPAAPGRWLARGTRGLPIIRPSPDFGWASRPRMPQWASWLGRCSGAGPLIWLAVAVVAAAVSAPPARRGGETPTHRIGEAVVSRAVAPVGTRVERGYSRWGSRRDARRHSYYRPAARRTLGALAAPNPSQRRERLAEPARRRAWSRFARFAVSGH